MAFVRSLQSGLVPYGLVYRSTRMAASWEAFECVLLPLRLLATGRLGGTRGIRIPLIYDKYM
jgi:hypothetical protein